MVRNQESWWLQAFGQIDTPTSGTEARVNGEFFGHITEQTLLYTDVSVGNWLYRDRCCRCHGRCRVTGIAATLELHYTTSLNDSCGCLALATYGNENRFDVLNLTTGLTVELSDLWRINVAGAFPLRGGARFDKHEGRREDRFFDGEFILQANRLF